MKEQSNRQEKWTWLWFIFTKLYQRLQYNNLLELFRFLCCFRLWFGVDHIKESFQWDFCFMNQLSSTHSVMDRICQCTPSVQPIDHLADTFWQLCCCSNRTVQNVISYYAIGLLLQMHNFLLIFWPNTHLHFVTVFNMHLHYKKSKRWCCIMTDWLIAITKRVKSKKF